MTKVHGESALGPGASGLPYYYTTLVCVLNGLGGLVGGLAVWQLTHKQANSLLG